MAKLHDTIDDRIAGFIGQQKMFFVGTAPSSSDGHVNLSPKGYDSFRVLGPNKVAYLDLGGSGIETVAHVRENGRITFMFCAFEGKPNILRLYGQGEAVCFNEPGFDEQLGLFPEFPKARAVITADITRIQDSCGWGVPFYDFKSERDQLVRVNAHRTVEDWEERRFASNTQSVDGLPGLVKPVDAT
jgi:hypothetical protein